MDHQDEIAQAVWDWRKNAEARDSSKLERQNRIHGLIQGAIGLSAGSLVFLILHRTVGTVILAIAGSLTLLALISPLGAYARVKKAMLWFGSLVGTFTTWITLIPLYYLFFAPFHFLFRAGGRNKIRRGWDSKSDSYWHVRDQGAPASSYERQF